MTITVEVPMDPPSILKKPITARKSAIIEATKYRSAPAMLETSEGMAPSDWSTEMQPHSSRGAARPWTPDEDAFVVENFRKLSLKDMAQALGRSVNAVRGRRYNLGVSGNWKFQWTPEAERMVIAAYRHRVGKDSVDQKALAARIGCTLVSLQRKVHDLGLAGVYQPPLPKHGYTDSGRIRDRERKYATDEERRAANAARVKAWIAEHGHPRGALGMKHTSEAKKKMREAPRRWWATATEEQKADAHRRATLTRIKRHGTAGPVYHDEANAYSRTKGGRRADLNDRYFRSAWEANYARYLNWLVEQGDIQCWEYETDTFVFEGYTRGAVTYRPDFKVTERDGSVVYHEVKGWMDGPSKTRLKRMAKHYPDVKVIVIGEAEYRAIAKWKGMIPGWE